MSNANELVPVEVEETEVSEVSCNKPSKLETVCVTVDTTVPIISSLARDIISSRERIRMMKGQIAIIKENNAFNLQRMKMEFQEIKPTIESINNGIDKIMENLGSFDSKNMNAEDHETYRALLSTAIKMREQVLDLFKSIM